MVDLLTVQSAIASSYRGRLSWQPIQQASITPFGAFVILVKVAPLHEPTLHLLMPAACSMALCTGPALQKAHMLHDVMTSHTDDDVGKLC